MVRTVYRGTRDVDIAETLPIVDYIVGEPSEPNGDEWRQAALQELRDSSDECTEPEPF